ncbi:MAG: hypothetical protein CL568_03100 [Alphaproteobacteria bacterium]|jgi:hypothetical protein|nr:hypothetical protein [Alphaproteobacteria bacterium]PPR14613.1 MAG: hypothetical protein CFH42_00372 [Alphaproteobacteria bacterium MarineAlpha12_Bin1]|tara:strand:+ start:827 stop:1264 length:438 start_codon:yes stop_codon:yes gene_type:complete
MNKEQKPQIIVHDLDDAIAALITSSDMNIAVTLVSPKGAASYAGSGWFRELIYLAREKVPDAQFDSILDCSDDSGQALAALREGLTAIDYKGSEKKLIKIQDIAHQIGTEVLKIDYSQALDLSLYNNKRSASRDWLTDKLTKNSL